MQSIVKICKIHGKLTSEFAYKRNRKSAHGKDIIRYECNKCNYIKRKEWAIRNPERQKDYGLSKDLMQKMLEKQNHVCAICKYPETVKNNKTGITKSLAIDHCHVTGKIRGLLCQKCNSAIGSLRDDIAIMQSAIDYIKAHQ